MAQGNTQTLRTTNTYAMAVTALMTAVTCILAPLSIPIGPVPISLTNLQFIFLSIFWIGRKERSAISFIFFSDLWDFLYFPDSPEESESLPDQLADISLVSSQWQSLPVL
mgnify:CR=1 FL=1